MSQNNSRGAVKRLVLLLVLLIAALSLAACGKDGEDVVATYKGGQVTEKELNSFLGAHEFFAQDPMYPYYKMMPDFKESLLRQLIATRILGSEVDENTRKESDKEAKKNIDEMYDSINQDSESKKQFNQYMDELGIGKSDLTEYVSSQYTLQAYFENKYSEEDLRKEYDEAIAKDKNAFISTATVRHVLVATHDLEGQEIRTKDEAKKRAEEAYLKLKNGGDWNAIAKEYSDDPGSSESGGQYADVAVDQWVEQFREHAIHQPLNEVGEPFETEYGYHVMVVEKRNPNDFESVKDTVRFNLVNEFFTNFIQEGLDEQDLVITLPKEEPEGEDDHDAGTGSEDGSGESDGTGNAGGTNDGTDS